MSEQLKRFQFFNQEIIQDKQNEIDITLPSLNDLDISDGVYIEPNLFFGSKKIGSIFIYSNNSIFFNFKPFSESLLFIDKTSSYGDGLLISYGIDIENQSRQSCIKFWDVSKIDFSSRSMPSRI